MESGAIGYELAGAPLMALPVEVVPVAAAGDEQQDPGDGGDTQNRQDHEQRHDGFGTVWKGLGMRCHAVSELSGRSAAKP